MPIPLLRDDPFYQRRKRSCICSLHTPGGDCTLPCTHPEDAYPYGPESDIMGYHQTGKEILWWHRSLNPAFLSPPDPGFVLLVMEKKFRLTESSEKEDAWDLTKAIVSALYKRYIDPPCMAGAWQTAVHQLQPDGSFITGKLWYHRYAVLCPETAWQDVLELPMLKHYRIVRKPDPTPNAPRLVPRNTSGKSKCRPSVVAPPALPASPDGVPAPAAGPAHLENAPPAALAPLVHPPAVIAAPDVPSSSSNTAARSTSNTTSRVEQAATAAGAPASVSRAPSSRQVTPASSQARTSGGSGHDETGAGAPLPSALTTSAFLALPSAPRTPSMPLPTSPRTASAIPSRSSDTSGGLSSALVATWSPSPSIATGSVAAAEPVTSAAVYDRRGIASRAAVPVASSMPAGTSVKALANVKSSTSPQTEVATTGHANGKIVIDVDGVEHRNEEMESTAPKTRAPGAMSSSDALVSPSWLSVRSTLVLTNSSLAPPVLPASGRFLVHAPIRKAVDVHTSASNSIPSNLPPPPLASHTTASALRLLPQGLRPAARSSHTLSSASIDWAKTDYWYLSDEGGDSPGEESGGEEELTVTRIGDASTGSSHVPADTVSSDKTTLLPQHQPTIRSSHAGQTTDLWNSPSPARLTSLDYEEHGGTGLGLTLQGAPLPHQPPVTTTKEPERYPFQVTAKNGVVESGQTKTDTAGRPRLGELRNGASANPRLDLPGESRKRADRTPPSGHEHSRARFEGPRLDLTPAPTVVGREGAMPRNPQGWRMD